MTDPQVESSRNARFAACNGLLVRHFGDEAVVFDPVSWDAHLLNPAALAVLELLIEAPRSELDVATLLREALQPAEQPKAIAHARHVIGVLESLGLVQLIEATPVANR